MRSVDFVPHTIKYIEDWSDHRKMMHLLVVVALLCYAVLGAAQELNATTSVSSWVIIQVFDWAALSDRNSLYSKVAGDAANIGSAGINAAWMPPPSQSVDAQGYLPQQWYQLVGETNLKNAISALSGHGVTPLADVVVNHRTAPKVDSCTGKYTAFSNPDMGK